MNMNKEYRAELRGLKKAKAKIERDYRGCLQAIHREDRRAFEECSRKRRALARDAGRAAKAMTRATARITNRIAVLEGRLS
jgi:hypothetical protein